MRDGQKTAERVMEAYVDNIREGKGVRRLLSEARRQLVTLMRANAGDRDLEGLMKAAFGELDEAVNAMDRVIGVATAKHFEVMSSEDTGKRVAGFVWNDVKAMRVAVDSMAAQCSAWEAKEKESVKSGEARFDFSRHYKMAKDALDECSDKLLRVERAI
jgi:hypothetical protein